MKCPKCGFENVQVQAKKNSGKIILGIALGLGGIGLMIFSIFGLLIGGALGAIIGLIISAVKPTYKSVLVCQNCGYCGKVKRSKDPKGDEK